MTKEQQAMEQLASYRQKQARLQVLSTYSVGAGITVSRLNEDDQLQELHARLRGLPSYMYLSKREQKLEQTAHAYLTRYPAGIKAQKRAVLLHGADAEDEKLLAELRWKISKVFAARGYDVRSDIDEVIERVTEFQDLQAEINRLDFLLNRLGDYEPNQALLLRLLYVEGLSPAEVADRMQVTERTVSRRRRVAEEEYIRLAK